VKIINFIIGLSLDKEVSVKFWMSFGARVQTVDRDKSHLGGGLHCLSAHVTYCAFG